MTKVHIYFKLNVIQKAIALHFGSLFFTYLRSGGSVQKDCLCIIFHQDIDNNIF